MDFQLIYLLSGQLFVSELQFLYTTSAQFKSALCSFWEDIRGEKPLIDFPALTK